MADTIRILDITYYMDCPPVSGGTLRILSPFMKMDPSSGVSVDMLFSTYSQEYADSCSEYLEKIPVIDHAEGVVTRYYQTMHEGCPKDFSTDVWQTISRELRDRAVEIVKENKYDVIQIEHSQLSWIVPFLRLASPDSYIVLDCHNVEYMIFEKWLPYADKAVSKQIANKFKTLRGWEMNVWKWYDAALSISPIEEDILHSNGIEETYLVPTGGGIDPEKYEPKIDDRERPYDILYIGTMNWFPNAHGLLWFINEVFPKILERRPDTMMHIVGSGDPNNELFRVARNHKNIKFWGQQKDDVQFFHNSKVFVVPLWIGAGARVKILTAWAAKIPIVSTVFGAEGNEAINGHNIILADDPDEYAEGVLKLLDDPAECKRIYDNAFDILEKKYTVQCCVDTLVNAYHKMAENAKKRL